jgi:hypothetical protein
MDHLSPRDRGDPTHGDEGSTASTPDELGGATPWAHATWASAGAWVGPEVAALGTIVV